MKLSKEELKERNVIAASIRFYEEEQKNVRKYHLMSVAAMLIAIAIGAYIYVDSGACFRKEEKKKAKKKKVRKEKGVSTLLGNSWYTD